MVINELSKATSECRLDEFLEVEVAIVIALTLQLVGELDDVNVGQSHLSQNLHSLLDIAEHEGIVEARHDVRPANDHIMP